MPSSESQEIAREWRPLSPVKQEMLRRLLSVEFAGKHELLTQADSLTAEGSIRRSIAINPGASAPVANVQRRIPVEAEFEDTDGVTVHVLLHVVDGLMNELEIYREDSAPILGDRLSNGWRLVVL